MAAAIFQLDKPVVICHHRHSMRFNGAKLKELREARSWDQHRLAQEARVHGRAGITQAAVSRHENGMQPTPRNATAYAKALGVAVMELFELDDDEEAALATPLTREEQ